MTSDELDKEELKQSLKVIKHSSKSLLTLTENLLSLANLQTGKLKPHFEELPLSTVILQLQDLFVQSALQKEIELKFDYEADIVVTADSNMIEMIIRNLLSNAIKFTHKKGKVHFQAYSENGYCKIIITDDGVGMSQEYIDRVLNLELKTNREGTDNEAGTGLGLVLCSEMVELNNGKMKIESQEGKGSMFTVFIPLAGTTIDSEG